MTNLAIETHELTRHYGDTVAVDALTLNVAQGEIFGFLGHNGAGKTTTVNMLTTLILPDSGSARVAGHDVVTENLAVRQRVGVAQALMHGPEVLFLDEPSSGLDPEATREVDDLILMLNREFGMTVFMNTHLLSQVTRICTSIGIMNQGRLMVADSLPNITARFAEERSLEDIYLHFRRNGSTVADEVVAR
ncbi:MAG: ATP-binding cassette domain-containing protein [Actinomycetia bacterium]|nr:ATP-binding cassette domain-containing protein [Actinomycetes bacterium]